MRKLKAQQERIIGIVNGKRVKTTAKKWFQIMEDPKNSVLFKEDKDDEQVVEAKQGAETEVGQGKEDTGDVVHKSPEE